MKARTDRRLFGRFVLAALLWGATSVGLAAQTSTPTAPAGSSVTAPPQTAAPVIGAPAATTPKDAPPGKTAPAADGAGTPAVAPPQGAPAPNQPQPGNTEGENGAPGLLDSAATETVEVPSRPIVMVKGSSSYDDAFNSIKASLDKVKAAMAKAGLKPAGHPITIFSEPDDKGFKYEAAVPVAQTPDKADLGDGVTVGTSPSGKAIKFQHRNDYESIDSTYDAIAAYLDAKGILASNPYVEEYLGDLTTADDPNLQVDIYVFIKSDKP